MLGSGDQSLYWLIVAPLVGVLWVALQFLTAPFFGQRGQNLPETLRRFAVASTPLVLLGLFVAACAWKWNWGVWWGSGIWGPWKRALNPPWPWLLWAYEGCAAVTLIAQFVVHRRVFQIPGLRALAHLAVSLVLVTLAAAGTGAFLQELLGRLL